jgi:hypothetical protein
MLLGSVNYEAQTNAKGERRTGKQSSRRNTPTLSIQPQPRVRSDRQSACASPATRTQQVETAGCTEPRSDFASPATPLAPPPQYEDRSHLVAAMKSRAPGHRPVSGPGCAAEAMRGPGQAKPAMADAD